MRNACALSEAQIKRILEKGCNTIIAPVKARYRKSDTFIDSGLDDPAWGILDAPFKPGDVLAVRETWKSVLLGDCPYIEFKAGGDGYLKPMSFDDYEALFKLPSKIFGTWMSARSLPARLARMRIKILSANQLKRSEIDGGSMCNAFQGHRPFSDAELEELWNKEFARRYAWKRDSSMWVYKFQALLEAKPI